MPHINEFAMATCVETVMSSPSSETDRNRPATTLCVSQTTTNNGRNSIVQNQLVASPYIDTQTITGNDKVEENGKGETLSSPINDEEIITDRNTIEENDMVSTLSSTNNITSDTDKIEDENEIHYTDTVNSEDAFTDSVNGNLGVNETSIDNQALGTNGTECLESDLPTRGRQVEQSDSTERKKQISIASELKDSKKGTPVEDNSKKILEDDVEILTPMKDTKLMIPTDYIQNITLKANTQNGTLKEDTESGLPISIDVSQQGDPKGKDHQVTDNIEKEAWQNSLHQITEDKQRNLPGSQSQQSDAHMMDVNATDQTEYIQEYIYLASDCCLGRERSAGVVQETKNGDPDTVSTPNVSFIKTLDKNDEDETRETEKSTSDVPLKVSAEANETKTKNSEIKAKYSSKLSLKEAIDLLAIAKYDNGKDVQEVYREEASIVLQQVTPNSVVPRFQGKEYRTAARATKYVDLQNSMKVERIGRAEQNTHYGKHLPDNRNGHVNVLRQVVPRLTNGKTGEYDDEEYDEEHNKPYVVVPRGYDAHLDVFRSINSHVDVPRSRRGHLGVRRGDCDIPRRYDAKLDISRSYDANLDVSRSYDANPDISRSYDSHLQVTRRCDAHFDVPRKHRAHRDVSLSSEESHDDLSSISGLTDEDVNRDDVNDDDATKTSVTLLVVSVVLLALAMSHPISANLIAVTVFFSLSKSSPAKPL
ncbi:hypothetical protein Pmani_030863 [Petrolisthes manimaculis]|uniref:Uncharacterized protein n=1 Tax=Petrolisthes manimaculis TaxID=1843537 RepID=A0AAE1TSI3_9EUCA|nr:hypothetical protein Pmani_030863 [Petrolisthes manimaculis]